MPVLSASYVVVLSLVITVTVGWFIFLSAVNAYLNGR